jgi:hypothetical protein
MSADFLLYCRPSTTDDIILNNLSPPDLFRYSRANKGANQVVSSYMKRAFNIQNVMGRFFSETEMSYFLFLQSRTGMLISGSTALQLFERTVYPESDLDLYVEHRYCKVIASWLVTIGYAFKPRPGHSEKLEEALGTTTPVQLINFVSSSVVDYLDSRIINVYNFQKSNSDCKIQLITSRHSPLEVILKFHSSKCHYFITFHCYLHPITISMCHEFDHARKGLFTISSRYIQRTSLPRRL